jgi:hypothetical protein
MNYTKQKKINMPCGCKKKKEKVIQQPEPQVISVPQTVEELHATEMAKHAEELASQISNEENHL